ncbi:DNA alkylation repair protein [Jiulongibacter sediminis]|jgi:3-methyladenine DNA glycosylase AlkD|uniref:DNA alkylation repair protein n=1 Tax=Jiulongibacter sediminis TaxID=1605367 RepID=UPI0026F0D45C|nr:DNA alkylation repair protein [Jiulongibacter sediminis]
MSALYPLFELLNAHADDEYKESMKRFFKTGKGEYAEHDEFMGLKTTAIRKIIKPFYHINKSDLSVLITHPIHEIRMAGLLILVKQYQKNRKKDPEPYVNLYLDHLDYVNNWDLVDGSCRDLLGDYLITRPRDILYKLANEENIWKQRVAIVSTYALIKTGDFTDTFEITKRMFDKKEDILLKGIGWMLREINSRGSQKELEEFLTQNISDIQGKVLTIAIQDFSQERKQFFKNLKGEAA